jgi:hypothetical protein
MKWLRPGLLICAALPLLATAEAPKGPPGDDRPANARFDAACLRPGRFVYRLMQEGKEVAKFALTIRRQADGSFRFTGEAAGFDQRWESVATPAFEPIAAALQLQRAGGQRYSMRLAYHDGRVTGTATTVRAENAEKTPVARDERAISDPVPAGTVDQRIDWAAVLSSRLESGLRFTVYDPESGTSQVGVEVGEAGQTAVPAGTYETVRAVYRIEKSHHTEAYEIQATQGSARMMVRETFPNGIVSELVEISAAPGAASE